MVTIHHNFDRTQFKWLWSRYVTSGRLEYHCVQSIPGKYSKKFSGASNPLFNEQRTINMDEVADGKYEAIYFCGVIKKGYLNKNPLKNNYIHNVHFAVAPKEGAHDVWDFENWHVEIDNGVLEKIPATYELNECFFKEPYTSHYYTCRIFRWMVGHFYPDKIHDILHGRPEAVVIDGTTYQMRDKLLEVIALGRSYAILQVESSALPYRNHLINGDFDRSKYREELFSKVLERGLHDVKHDEWIDLFIRNKTPYSPEIINLYFKIGVEEYLETISTYQDRNFIAL